MKYIKILGLAVGAAAAFMAFVGAGTASATVLCKTNTTPCGSMVEKGTELKGKLVAGTEANLHAGFAEIKCKESTVSGKTSTTGANAETVEAANILLTFGNCTGRVQVKLAGKLIAHYVSEMNGLLTSQGAEVEVEQAGVTCTYGTPAATTIGPITGGAPAKIKAEAELTKISGGFLCASPAHWEAQYEVTSPNPLYVAAS